MARKLVVNIVGDATSLERAFKKSSKSANTFGRSMTKSSSTTQRAFGGMTRGAFGLAGAFIGPVGLVVAAKAAFGEFAQGQKVMAQTNAVIKSTGGVASVSAKHVAELADQMLRKTGIDDEATQAAENWLLTFKGIRNEQGKNNKVFDRATKAVADLATAQADGAVPSLEQMVGASKLLGKALDDPERGLTALKRAGIGFSEQQKEQIKVALEHNDVLKAQDIILDEVTKQTGGRAVAAGKTFAGQWAIVRETVLNLSAVLVAKLMPSIQKLLQQLAKWLNNSKNQKQVLDTVKAAASALESTVRLLAGAFKLLNAVTGSAKNTFKVLLAGFVVFKGLKLAAYIFRMAAAMRSFAFASAAANAAATGGLLGGGGGRGKGKAGKLGRLAGKLVLPVSAAIALAPVIEKAGVPFEQWKKLFKATLPDAAARAVRPPAGARGPVGAMVINGGVHLHGVQNVKQLENDLMKRHKQRAHPRRGNR